MKKQVWLVLLLGISVASCQKENVVPLDTPQTPNAGAVATVTLLSQSQLSGFLPASLNGYSQNGDYFTNAKGATQLTRQFISRAGTRVNVSLADMGNVAQGTRDNFFTGYAYNIASTSVAPTALLLAADRDMGFSVNQYTGSGAMQLALNTGAGNTLGLYSTQLNPINSSYVRAYANAANPDVAGWQVYDSETGTGTLTLMVNNRFALVIDGTGLASDIKTLMGIDQGMDYKALVALGN